MLAGDARAAAVVASLLDKLKFQDKEVCACGKRHNSDRKRTHARTRGVMTLGARTPTHACMR